MTKKHSIEAHPPDEPLKKRQWFSGYRIARISGGKPGEVTITYDYSKIKHFLRIFTCCPDEINGKAREIILKVEGQLVNDQGVAESLGYVKPLNEATDWQRALLRIDMMHRGEKLANFLSKLYKFPEDKQAALCLIYERFVLGSGNCALGILMRMLSDYDNKEVTGKFLIYVHGKLLAYSILSQDKDLIARTKQSGQEVDELLIAKQLGHLVEAPPKCEVATTKRDTCLPFFTKTIDAIKYSDWYFAPTPSSVIAPQPTTDGRSTYKKLA
jgi:hypothetical protein